MGPSRPSRKIVFTMPLTKLLKPLNTQPAVQPFSDSPNKSLPSWIRNSTSARYRPLKKFKIVLKKRSSKKITVTWQRHLFCIVIKGINYGKVRPLCSILKKPWMVISIKPIGAWTRTAAATIRWEASSFTMPGLLRLIIGWTIFTMNLSREPTRKGISICTICPCFLGIVRVGACVNFLN